MKTQFRHSFTGRLSRLLLLPMLVASALGSAPLSTAHAIGAIITVDTLDGGLVDGAGSGDCSLAEAIVNANDDAGSPYADCTAGAGDDDIVFSLGGTIMLTATLPTIDDPDDEMTVIDGDGHISIDGSGAGNNGIVYISGDATFRQLILANALDTCCSAGAVGVNPLGSLTVEESLFFNNYAPGLGGAIYNAGTLSIDRSTFTSNGAGLSGGAIYTEGVLTVSNSTFYDNDSSVAGGGIGSYGTTTIYSTTFSGNSAPAGTGEAVHVIAGSTNLYNSILANSTSGYDCDVDGGAAGGTYSLIEDDNCGFTDGVSGMILGEDPRLGSLVDVPAYFLLKADSPAIDSGDVAQQDGPTDEPGNSRVGDVPWAPDTGDDNGTGSIIDMGAYEYQISCYVPETMYVDQNATGDQLGTSWDDAFTDLQMALYTAANCSNPEEIWVAAGVYKPDAGDPGNRNTTFMIPPGTRVYGGFAGTETMISEQDWQTNATILSGDIDDNDTNVDGNNIAEDYTSVQGSNSYHVVYFDGTITPITVGTALDGFVITGGLANSSVLNSEGAGILCLAPGASDVCSPTLTNLLISGNLAAYGGGMFIEVGVSTSTGSPSLQDVIFRGNRATGSGGGVFNHSSGVGNPSLTNVTFSNNSAGVHGGGMVNAGSGGAASSSLQNVTFHSNSAAGNGGGMWNVGYSGANGVSSPVLKNVTFTGNSADKGGGMENQTLDPSSVSSPVLYNVILWADSATTSGDEIMNEAAASSTVNPSLDHVVVEGGCPAGSSCANLGTANPMLGSLQDNGGFTETVALLAGSSAIDTGDDSICAAAPVSNLDQRGVARPQGPHCDIGAYEVDFATHVFDDMPVAGKEWMEPWVNAFYYGGITTGCGANPLIYCPEGSVTRASMAVFILRAKYGATYVPPAATHTFSDMPVAGKEWMEPWVDQLYAEGITTGCAASPLRYCPENPVTRSAMAVFLLRALEGSSYTPPAATHTFADLPVAGKEWMEPWVDEFYTRGITTGCGAAPLIYCPENPVTRAAMAVFIDRAYGLYP